MNNKQIIFGAQLAFVIILPSSAQGSKEYAQLAKASWSAFECSSLASKAGNAGEQERLFLYGFKQGKKFISAVQSKKVNQKDLSSEAPLVMLLLLEGPSPDFMLGRIYESAQDSALKDVFNTEDYFNSDEEQKTIAKNRFLKLNCQLIGNAR
jgi:hypothetical protein